MHLRKKNIWLNDFFSSFVWFIVCYFVSSLLRSCIVLFSLSCSIFIHTNKTTVTHNPIYFYIAKQTAVIAGFVGVSLFLFVYSIPHSISFFINGFVIFPSSLVDIMVESLTCTDFAALHDVQASLSFAQLPMMSLSTTFGVTIAIRNFVFLCLVEHLNSNNKQRSWMLCDWMPCDRCSIRLQSCVPLSIDGWFVRWTICNSVNFSHSIFNVNAKRKIVELYFLSFTQKISPRNLAMNLAKKNKLCQSLKICVIAMSILTLKIN